MKKRSLVIVEWEDITTIRGWWDEEEAKEDTPLKCISVGWKLVSTKNHLSLIASRSENADCGDRITIPKGCIRSIRRIE